MAANMNYIVVTGGTLSGVGKGITASSIGVILQSMGHTVTFIKIDPYINSDAGTLNPFDHGEVYVLEDGTETDLDLGNYERFLNISLTGKHSITTGKIFKELIEREREGVYLGKTVQIVPHATDLIKEKIVEVAHEPIKVGIAFEDEVKVRADFCIIELGGTVGDIESLVFIEALRQLKREAVCSNFLVVSVEFLPQLSNKEIKTKPVQNSIKKSLGLGIKPDIIICRCESPIDEPIKEKISLFCEVEKKDIFQSYTLKSVYDLPEVLNKQGLFKSITDHLKIKERKKSILRHYNSLARNEQQLENTIVEGEECLKYLKPNTNLCFSLKERFGQLSSKYENCLKISIIGKYVTNNDCYMSLYNAIKFSAAFLKIEANINWVEASDLEVHDPEKFLDGSDCIIVPGGFGPRGVEGKIRAIQYARINNIPFLGICLGFQMAVVEFCRNVLGMKDAHSEEFIKNDDNVIVYLNQYNQKSFGGTMRLGNKPTILKDCRVKEWYGVNEMIHERHRHRYEVNTKVVNQLEEHKFEFVGKSENLERMEIFDYKINDFHIGVQFHPEFNARPNLPHCLFNELMTHALNKRQNN